MCKIREADRAEVAVDTMDGLSVQAISKFLVLLQFSGENVRVFALNILLMRVPACSLISEHNSSLSSSILGTQSEYREFTLYSPLLTCCLIKNQASVACVSGRVGSRNSGFQSMTTYLRHSLLEHSETKIRHYL